MYSCYFKACCVCLPERYYRISLKSGQHLYGMKIMDKFTWLHHEYISWLNIWRNNLHILYINLDCSSKMLSVWKNALLESNKCFSRKAIRGLSQKTHLPESSSRTYTPRRACLYIPGNDRRKLKKSETLDADCIIMDCEDGVAINKKVCRTHTTCRNTKWFRCISYYSCKAKQSGHLKTVFSYLFIKLKY